MDKKEEDATVLPEDYLKTSLEGGNHVSIDSENSLSCLNPQSGDHDATSFKGFTRFQITIEPLFFILMYNDMLTSGITINLYQRNACNLILDLNNITCHAKSNSTHMEKINAMSAEINMINNLIQMIFPLVLSLFAGPWSDKNGRKLFMVLPTAGYTLYFAALAVMSWFPSMDPMYLIIPSIPLSASGTMMVIYLCSYCYLCDIFEHDKRSFRFSINWSLCLFGSVLANSTVTPIFNVSGDYGYQVIYIICSITSFLAFIYTQFFLKETITRQTRGYSCLIDLNFAKDVVKVMIIHPKDGHLKVLLNLFITFSVGGILLGESTVEYLIGQVQYSWSLGMFSLFTVITVLWSALCCALIPMLLQKLFKMKDTSIVILSGSIMLLAEVGKALSVSELMFWICTAFMKQYSQIAPIMNALMADLVTIEDMGKLFAFTGLVDTVSSYISVPLYTKIYEYCLERHQVLYTYLLSSALGVVITLSALSLAVINKYKRTETTQL